MLALIQQILGIVSTLVGLVGEVLGLVQTTAKEHVQYGIETITTNIGVAVAHPTYGLAAIHSDLADVHDHVDSLETDVQTIIGAINLLSAQVGEPVQVPSAPGWYSAPPTEGTIADTVWQYESVHYSLGDEVGPLTMQQILEDAWAYATYQAGWVGVALPWNPYFAMCWWEPWKLRDVFGWNAPSYGVWDDVPLPDWSLWQDGDSVLTFLQRALPGYTWTATGPGGADSLDVAWTYGPRGGDRAYWLRSNFTALDAQVKSITSSIITEISNSVTVTTAPVWPGLANVTLGTPVALADQLVVTEAMDGVLVSVTTPPGKLGSYLVGNAVLDYGVGRIAFESDGEEIEPWQYLGFRQAIYTPKSMQRAAKARFQVLGGAGGTVTPWTVS